MRESLLQAAWMALCLVLAATAAAAPAPRARQILTSEAARRASPAELERLIVAHLGQRVTVVETQLWGHFGFKAVVRLAAHAEGRFCSAAQLSMTFMPNPALAPARTRPGAIHASRLPLAAGEIKAAQVYRSHAAALAGWKRLVERDPCEVVDPGLPFFAADGADQAGDMLGVFERLVRAAADPAQPLRLTCGEGREESCRQAIAALRPEEILSAAERCPGMAAREQGRCARFELHADRIGNGACSRTLLADGRRDAPAIERAWLSSACVVV